MTRYAPRLLILIALLLVDRAALSQDDPFGGDLFGPTTPEASGELPAATEDGATAADGAAETDPAVIAILESDPQTPRELVRSVQLLRQLERPEAAKRFLDQLTAANLSPEVLAALPREFGSAMFLRWSRDPALQPEGSQFADSVLAAAAERVRDPARITELIKRLSDERPETRRAAMLDLNQAGDAAISALIAALVDQDPQTETADVRRALARMRPAPIEPLAVALRSGSESLQAEAARVFQEMQSPKSLPFLLAPALIGEKETLRQASRDALRSIVGSVPTPSAAEEFLNRRVRDALRRTATADRSSEEAVWSWSPEQQTVVTQQTSAPQAYRLHAAHLAEELSRLNPHNQEARELYQMIQLEAEQRAAGLDTSLELAPGSLPERISELEPVELQSLLTAALDRDYSAAATVILDIMALRGSREFLLDGSGRPTPLIHALRHTDRRVRFAATRAVAAIQPTEPYPGASFFPEALAYFIRSVGTPRSLVIHPRTEIAQTLVAVLGNLGFEGDVATSGWEGYKLARRDPDYELILVSDGIDRPPLSEWLNQLRHDPLTAEIPIGVMARPERLDALQRLAEDDRLTEAFPLPYTEMAMAIFAERLSSLAEDELVPFAVRVRQARVALEVMLRLAANSRTYPFYDLMRQQDTLTEVLFESGLAAQAAPVLGQLGSPQAQRALISAASQHGRDLQVRQAAAAAFEAAVERRGLLLTRPEILQQYDLYNQSAQLDKDTQQVLGSILDAIEKPTAGQRPPGDSAADS